MLEIKGITKRYKTGDLVQTALDDVSLSFRDNEFVAILGPSGSGKTTLLNVVGGLDRYDSGDLVINNTSTKKYKDRDWDTYRNHSIGFVFQSYNLIPHQSILSNVELALTISGVSKKERRQRAKDALKEVGLVEQIHKRPNQLSGGQMQRVAIARALVNNPTILLADEPTGALDSQTSVQVMELLKKVANDRLVIMVTHNPDLAEDYANRIVKLKDGKIIEDTNPFEIEAKEEQPKKKEKRKKKASMSFFTSLALSFNNLRTKKGRTLLTSFAGSIGIIGIALILSLSNGVNAYIDTIQKDTMTSYPIQIKAQSFDLSGMMELGRKSKESSGEHNDKSKIYSNTKDFEMAQGFADSLTENNLTDFKKYLDSPDCDMKPYIGENGISYGYKTKFDIYTYDDNEDLVNTDGSTLAENDKEKMALATMAMTGSNSSSMSDFMSKSNFTELMSNNEGEISKAISDKYDILYGAMPKNYDEIVIVADSNNEISASILYQLGFLPTKEYKEMMKKLEKDEEINLESKAWTFEEICKKEFYLIPECDYYEKNDNGVFERIEDNEKIEDLLENALKLKITGVIKPNDDDSSLIGSVFGYTQYLTKYLIDYTDKSEVVKAQKENKDINVLNSLKFEPETDADKIADAKKYISNMGVTEKANLFKTIIARNMSQEEQEEFFKSQYEMPSADSSFSPFAMPQIPTQPATKKDISEYPDVISKDETETQEATEPTPLTPEQQAQKEQAEQMAKAQQQMQEQMEQAQQQMQEQMIQAQQAQAQAMQEQMAQMQQAQAQMAKMNQGGDLTEADYAEFTDKYLENADDDVLLDFYEKYVKVSTYKDNLEAFGVVSLDSPSSIDIYADSFEDKDKIGECIENYNKRVSEENKITYTDAVKLLMSSVTTIVNVISYVLIAFVAVSLVVSSIMIGIITYISVLERTKEIGILRALGASKRNISSVFRAETIIVGLCSGIIGIGITLLLLIPGNAIIHALVTADVSAYIPVTSSVILIVLSMLLTLIGGLIPAKKAAKKDPVTALRTE